MTDDYKYIAGVYNILFSRALKQLREDIRTYIYHRRFKTIVDLCCGTGEQLSLLDRQGLHITGIDNSVSMLEQARQHCPPDTELHLLDAEQESFIGGSYDCVILSLALHEKHPRSLQTIFTNARNLVREKGVIIVADYNHPSSSLYGAFIARIVIPLIERCAGKDHYNNYKSWMQHGGLEGFLSNQGDTSDIISQPLASALLCCAVTKFQSGQHARESFGLLQHTLSTQP